MSTARSRCLNPRRLGIVQILTGTAAGHGLALVTAPLLARLYSPAHFGMFTVVSAVILSLATVFALRLDFAVPLPRDPGEAAGIAVLAHFAIAVFAVASFVVILLFGDRIVAAFGQPELMPWLLLAPAAAAAMASCMVLNQLAVRDHRFADLGRRNLLQSTVTVISQLVIGLAGGRPSGLVLGVGLGQAAGAASLLPGSGLRGWLSRAGRGRPSLAGLLRRYRRFPLVLAPSGLVNTLGLQLPVVLIAHCYGGQVAGWLGLTQRVLAIPVMLLGTAVAQVYLGELARSAHRSRSTVAGLFSSTSRGLAIVGALVCVPLLGFGPALFGLIFGAQWLPSGQYARALSIALLAQLVAAPLSQTLIVLGDQLTQAAWDVTRLLLTSSAVLLCAYTGRSAETAVWALSASSAGAFALSWWLSRRAIQRTAGQAGPIASSSSVNRG